MNVTFTTRVKTYYGKFIGKDSTMRLPVFLFFFLLTFIKLQLSNYYPLHLLDIITRVHKTMRECDTFILEQRILCIACVIDSQTVEHVAITRGSGSPLVLDIIAIDYITVYSRYHVNAQREQKNV